MFYDVVIVGGGMAGLYTAYIMKKKFPEKKVIILEKNTIGGRADSELFHGVSIPKGAGVGRKRKDKLLQQLLKELKIPTKEFMATNHCPSEMKEIWKTLVDHYSTSEKKMFREYAISIIGLEKYQQFVISTGYSDFEQADVYETLFYYGMDDNLQRWKGISIPWKQLITRLAEGLQIHKTEVLSFSRTNDILVKTSKKDYHCDQLILATTISTIRKLLPVPIYHQIVAQPFLRIYATFAKTDGLPTSTIVVGGLIQKMIPMNIEKGVYMIVYNDNRASLILEPKIKNTISNREYFSRLVEKSLELPDHSLEMTDMISFFWSEGTHYYKPLTGNLTREQFLFEAQFPEPNVFVVGEAVSRKQGWVEGALESVLKLF
jgi:hypothetical protein